MLKTLKQSLLQSFVTASLLPIMVISGLVLYTLTAERRQDVGAKNLLLAKAISGQVEAYLREPQAMLATVVGLLDTEHADLIKQQALLDSVVNTSRMFESIYLLDKTGNVLTVGLSENKLLMRRDFVGMDLSHFLFFQQALTTGQPTWSDTFLSVISGNMSLALAMRVNDHVLVGNFSIYHLVSYIQQLQLGKGVIITIIDRDGEIIVHPDPITTASEVYVGHLEPVKRALAGEEGAYRYRDNGGEQLGSAVFIHGPKWVALISQDIEQAFMPVYKTASLLLFGILGALLISVLFSITKARKLCAPLSDLSKKAKSIAEGDYDVTILSATTREMSELTGSLQEMAKSIKEREDEILESREEYRRLVETMNDGLIVLNTEGAITYMNPQFADIIGYGTQYLLGKSVAEFLNEENRAVVRHQLELRKKGESEHYELEWTKANGDPLYTLVSPKTIYKYKEYFGSFAIVTDITRRKKAEESIRQSLIDAEGARDKIDAIFRSVPHALVVTDNFGKIVMLNRNAEELFGKSIYTLLYYPIQAVIAEQAFKELFVAILKGQVASHSVDIDIFSHAENEVRSFEVSCSTVSSKDDVGSGIVIVLEDVTKVRESDRMKSEFIAIAAHELNTPLTSVLGYTELLLDEDHVNSISDTQQREYLETIYTKGELLNRLVDDLLYLSRFEAGRTVFIDKTQCHIEQLIRTIIVSYRRENPEWTFDLSFSDDDVILDADVSKVGQVVENLLNNAIKYSAKNKMITVKGGCDGSWYQVDIVDSGIGMSPDELSHVFEKFYRAHPAMSAIAGLGLGMTIVKNIIDAHAGKVWLKSEKGVGTTVSFVLPLQKKVTNISEDVQLDE